MHTVYKSTRLFFQYGLYSSLCGGIIYTLLGTIPELNVAPTALISLLTYTYTHNSPAGAANACVLLCLLGGAIQLACGLLRLGFLVDFVSTPVVAGFTSAGAVTIASAQFKNLLGLSFAAETFVEVMRNVAAKIGETKKWDAVLGGCCCAALLAMRRLRVAGSPPLAKAAKGEGATKMGLRKAVWFLSVSRNALVVVGCAVLAFVFDRRDERPFSLTCKCEP